MRITNRTLCVIEGTDINPAIEHKAPVIEVAESSRHHCPDSVQLKVFAMRQTDVAALRADPIITAKLMRASIRFVASVGALIGVSLLLAWL
jgi:hypothetical protein